MSIDKIYLSESNSTDCTEERKTALRKRYVKCLTIITDGSDAANKLSAQLQNNIEI